MLNKQVADVLQGQLTDRMGIIKGAVDTYKQALLVNDITVRNQLLTQAVSELNKGRRQLIESLESKTEFINKLPQSSFKQFCYSIINKIDINEIETKFLETQLIFDNIIKSSNYIALVYEELGEVNTLRESFPPLKECIKEYSDKMRKAVEFLPIIPTPRVKTRGTKLPRRL